MVESFITKTVGLFVHSYTTASEFSHSFWHIRRFSKMQRSVARSFNVKIQDD